MTGASMTFKEAAAQKMPFGKYIGKTIDEVAETDSGLQYLDWLNGQNTYGRFKVALIRYLAEPAIVVELKKVVG